MSNNSINRRQPVKVLCLHGLTENTSIMERKLAPMIQHLPPNTFQFIYVSAPYVLPAISSAPVPHGSLKLKRNTEGEDRGDQDKDFNRACIAISYLLAAQSYHESEKRRHRSNNVRGMSDLVPRYIAELKTIDKKTIQRAEEHIFLTAAESTNDSRRWWTLPSKHDSRSSSSSPYIGQETGLALISKAMREQGPFDGVIGFSTDAMMASFCQALLLMGRDASSSIDPLFQPPADQTPFIFAVYFAPWLARDGPYGRHCEDMLHRNAATAKCKIRPALCFEGVRDRHLVKGSCGRFAECVRAERYEFHNGHSLPVWDSYPIFTAHWLILAAKQVRGELSREEAKKARLRLESPYQDAKMRQQHASRL